MASLLNITHTEFRKEMDASFDSDQAITSVDIFDSFVHALGKKTNVLEEEELKALVFKQFKSYGDFDKTMKEVAQNVSGIHQTTQDAINAIDSKDSGALKKAYLQLKDYEHRILELEEDLYRDDVTGAYNRKYLSNHELDENNQFKYEGVLIYLNIDNFRQVNKEHGHEAGDAVLKFVSRLLQNHLKSAGVNLVRYMGVEFVCVVKKDVSTKAETILKETVDLVLGKKFKTHEGEILSIELQFSQQPFSKGQSFQEVYESL